MGQKNTFLLAFPVWVIMEAHDKLKPSSSPCLFPVFKHHLPTFVLAGLRCCYTRIEPLKEHLP